MAAPTFTAVVTAYLLCFVKNKRWPLRYGRKGELRLPDKLKSDLDISRDLSTFAVVEMNKMQNENFSSCSNMAYLSICSSCSKLYIA